ncbi:AAA family ATPase, partial [Tepidimonas taiwanensis]
MQRRKLPIGIQTFREIREEGCYYVDKTPYAIRLIEQGKHYFLSRPRRFGKSLFLDTLAELFSGNRALFEGLYAEAHWDWSVRYPVIRISFAAGRLETREALEAHIAAELEGNAQRLGVMLADAADSHLRFRALIQAAVARHGQRAVVLIDEYDKPILDNLGDKAVAAAMREGLRNLYSVLKDQDAHLRF